MIITNHRRHQRRCTSAALLIHMMRSQFAVVVKPRVLCTAAEELTHSEYSRPTYGAVLGRRQDSVVYVMNVGLYKPLAYAVSLSGKFSVCNTALNY